MRGSELLTDQLLTDQLLTLTCILLQPPCRWVMQILLPVGVGGREGEDASNEADSTHGIVILHRSQHPVLCMVLYSQANQHTHTQTHNTQVYVFSLASERVGGQLGLMLCQGVSPSAYAVGTYIWCVSMLPPLRDRVRAYSITHTLCVTHTHTHIHMHTHTCACRPHPHASCSTLKTY